MKAKLDVKRRVNGGKFIDFLIYFRVSSSLFLELLNNLVELRSEKQIFFNFRCFDENSQNLIKFLIIQSTLSLSDNYILQ